VQGLCYKLGVLWP